MIKQDKHDILLSMIPHSARKILDVGCSDGGWVKKLELKDLEVVGIEKKERLYNEACKNLQQAFLADVEKFTPPYPEGYFDCIIYADVLEHLIDPYTVLKNHKKYLNDEGCVIVSIPNVRYYKVILTLALAGVWDYTDSGLLDKTHLRFFTLTNIEELFVNEGFKITELRRNIIAASGFKLLNFLCFDQLRELLVYQYYVKAVKQKGKERLQYSRNRKIFKL